MKNKRKQNENIERSEKRKKETWHKKKKKRKESKKKQNRGQNKQKTKKNKKNKKKPPFNTPQHSLFLVGSNNFFPFKTYIARWTIFDTRPPLILVTLFN